MWRSFKQPTSASQIRKNNPIEEINKNTYASSEMLEQILINNKKSERIAGIRFYITVTIMLITLLATLFPYIISFVQSK